MESVISSTIRRTGLLSTPLHLAGMLILLSAPKYVYHQTLCSDGFDQSTSTSFLLLILFSSWNTYRTARTITKNFITNIFIRSQSGYPVYASTCSHKKARSLLTGPLHWKTISCLAADTPRSMTWIQFLHAALKQIITGLQCCLG